MPICENNFTSKNLKKMPLVESLFNIKQDYRVKPRTLLNSITDVFIRVFWNRSAKKFGKLLEKRGVPFYYNCTNIVYSLLPDFSKHRLQEKYFLWLFWNSWKFARERSIMKSFNQLNASKKLSSYIFERMLEKPLLWKLSKIIRKTSLVTPLENF